MSSVLSKPHCAIFPKGYLPLRCPNPDCKRMRLEYGINDKGFVIYVECEKCGANSDDGPFNFDSYEEKVTCR